MIALESNSLLTFDSSSTVNLDNHEYGTTIKDIMELIPKDVAMGLLLTNIVPRISFLLTVKDIDIESLKQLLYILTIIAMHSPSSCEDILSCDGLMGILEGLAFPADYPLELGVNAYLVVSTLRLCRFLCLSSLEACKTIQKMGIFERAFRYLTYHPNAGTQDFKLQESIVIQVMSLLSVLVTYKQGLYLFDDYYGTIFESFSYYCRYGGSGDLGLASICSFISRQIISQGTGTVGGVDDKLTPFVKAVLGASIAFSGENRNSIITKTCVIRLLKVYLVAGFRYVGVYSPSFTKVLGLVFGKFIENLEINTQLLHEQVNAIKGLQPTIGNGFGFQDKAAFDDMEKILDLTVYSDFLAESNRLLEIMPSNQSNVTVFRELKAQICESAYLEVVNGYDTRSLSWMRLWASGFLNLIHSSISDINSQKGHDWYKIFSWLAVNSIPGDELVIKDYIAHWQKFLPQLSQIRSSNSDDLEFSLAVWHRDSQPAYLFAPLAGPNYFSETYFYDIAGQKEIGWNEKGLISYLELLVAIEESMSSKMPSPSSAILKAMNIFLLLDQDGKELYLSEAVQEALKTLFRAWTTRYNPEEIVFDYNTAGSLYQQFLDHFDSTAYGNTVFLNYLLLFCTKYNDYRFQEMFWNTLMDQIKVISCAADDGPWGRVDIFVIANQSKILNNAYAYIAASPFQERIPLLSSIAILAERQRSNQEI